LGLIAPERTFSSASQSPGVVVLTRTHAQTFAVCNGQRVAVQATASKADDRQ
jgi:hypothetical protein